jgi:hypothetical protein
MKRQRGRGRKPGGGGGGGGNNHNHGNRSLESNGPDVKIRGTAAQIYEKYSQYARDAQSGGDRVRYENFLQHAEHYYRVMAATMPRDRLLAQQNGEGGMQQSQQPGEGNVQAIEGGIPSGDTQDALKVVDDQSSDGDDGDDDIDADRGDDGDRAEVEVQARQDSAPQGNQDADQDGGGEGGGRGRRRRGRRGRNDGERSGGGNGGGDTEARSALDSLARKQGALTGG